MAFPASAGYGNLPNGKFSPTIYSKKVLLTLKKKAVVDAITNTDFAGDIATEGDTVRIIKQPNVTVQAYNRGQNIQFQDLNDDDITMTIDQSAYFGFYMDDIELAHEHVSFEDMAMDSGAYALKDYYDSNVLTNMATNAGTDLGTKTIGFGAGNDYLPLDLISAFCKTLDVANVPAENRFAVLSPAYFEALRREDSKLIDAQVMGDPKSVVRDSRLGTSLMIHGFKLYMSNNLPTNQIIAGHTGATATAGSILQSEVLRSTTRFGNEYRGLYVFGRKVIRPEALVKATVTIGDV